MLDRLIAKLKRGRYMFIKNYRPTLYLPADHSFTENLAMTVKCPEADLPEKQHNCNSNFLQRNADLKS